MNDFLQLVLNNGVEGLVAGFGVLLLVYAVSKGGIAVTGNQKRIANVVLSVLLAGVSILEPQADEVVVAALASVVSALAYEFVRFLAQKSSKG